MLGASCSPCCGQSCNWHLASRVEVTIEAGNAMRTVVQGFRNINSPTAPYVSYQRNTAIFPLSFITGVWSLTRIDLQATSSTWRALFTGSCLGNTQYQVVPPLGFTNGVQVSLYCASAQEQRVAQLDMYYLVGNEQLLSSTRPPQLSFSDACSYIKTSTTSSSGPTSISLNGFRTLQGGTASNNSQPPGYVDLPGLNGGRSTGDCGSAPTSSNYFTDYLVWSCSNFPMSVSVTNTRVFFD